MMRYSTAFSVSGVGLERGLIAAAVRRTARAAVVVSFTVCGIGACVRGSDEAAIRDALAAIQAGVEAKDGQAVLAHIAAGYRDQDGADRAALRRMMAVQFLRHRNIGVTVTNSEISVTGDRAETALRVLLTGFERLLPERVQYYRVRLEWRKQDDDWKVYRLYWEPWTDAAVD